MTQEDTRPVTDVAPLIGTVTVAPRLWVAVHTIGDEPEQDRPDGRMVVEVFHNNDGAIELDVYADGAVAFSGPNEDYPAQGWRTRIMPIEDSRYQQLVQESRRGVELCVTHNAYQCSDEGCPCECGVCVAAEKRRKRAPNALSGHPLQQG